MNLKTLKFLFGIFLINFPNFVWAQDTCSGDAVRLDSAGGSMAQVQLIDQGDLAICYACVAAQAAASAHGVREICPLAVAASTAVKSKAQMIEEDNALEASYVCQAVKAANQVGYCQNCGPFYDGLRAIDGGDAFFDELNRYFNTYREEVRGGSRRSWNDVINADAVTQFNENLCRIVPPVIRDDFVLPVRSLLLDAMKKNNPGILFQGMLERACSPRNPEAGTSTPSCRNLEWPSANAARELLRNHFTSNTVTPLGVEYCANMFSSEDPENFRSVHPDRNSRNGLTEWRAYDDKSDRIKWTLEQFDRKYMPVLETFSTNIQNEANNTELSESERNSRQALSNYINVVKQCVQNYRNRLNSRTGRRETIDMFFPDGEAAESPLATLFIEALSESNCPDFVAAQETVPEDYEYGATTRQAIIDSLNAAENEAREERNCGGHASLIIGKRCRGDRFQYLIRNTWGQDCDSYHYSRSGNTMECEASNSAIWVDEDIIINNSYRYNRFN